MPDQEPVSRDARYLQLANELRDLQQERQRTRPAAYLLFAIILGVLGLFLPFGLVMALVWLFAVASLLATVSAVVKIIRLNREMAQIEAQMNRLATATPATPAPVSAGQSIAVKIEQLQVLRDKNLITQEEFDAKKAELLRRI